MNNSKTWLLGGMIFLLTVTGCKTVPAKSSLANDEGRKDYRVEDYGEIKATDLSFDAQTGEIRYTLPHEARVRLRIGINHGGALLHHLLDWELRPAGSHVEKWDRKDATGRIDFGERMDYTVILNARPVKNPLGFPTAPSMRITFPESKDKTREGLPIVEGIASMRVLIDEKDRQSLTETSFEVALYVDLVFLMEDEVGTNPYNFRLDTSSLGEGEHLLTVNIIGYNGLVGTGTVKFFVRRP